MTYKELRLEDEKKRVKKGICDCPGCRNRREKRDKNKEVMAEKFLFTVVCLAALALALCGKSLFVRNTGALIMFMCCFSFIISVKY